jgi:hypothetical protein
VGLIDPDSNPVQIIGFAGDFIPKPLPIIFITFLSVISPDIDSMTGFAIAILLIIIKLNIVKKFKKIFFIFILLFNQKKFHFP